MQEMNVQTYERRAPLFESYCACQPHVASNYHLKKS